MNILDEVNSLFKRHKVSLKAEETATITLSAEAVLEDGTSIYTEADAWSEGVNVFTQDADGNPVPLPSGDYTLSDGSVLSVTDGILNTITPAEQMSATDDKTKEELATAQEHLAKMVELVKSLEAQLTSQNKVNVELSAEVSKLKKTPAVQSIKENFGKTKKSEPQTPSKTFASMTYEERFAYNLLKFNK
jgi:hypothetical protein